MSNLGSKKKVALIIILLVFVATLITLSFAKEIALGLGTCSPCDPEALTCDCCNRDCSINGVRYYSVYLDGECYQGYYTTTCMYGYLAYHCVDFCP